MQLLENGKLHMYLAFMVHMIFLLASATPEDMGKGKKMKDWVIEKKNWVNVRTLSVMTPSWLTRFGLTLAGFSYYSVV